MKRHLTAATIVLCLLTNTMATAHPAGGMVARDGRLAWAYVCPIPAIEHKACVMTWSERDGTQTWVQSERTASDWFLSQTEDGRILLVETAFDIHQQAHEYRMFQADHIGGSLTELFPWQADPHRFGLAGFAEVAPDTYLFVSYPSILIKRGNAPAEPWSHALSESDLYGIKAVSSNQLLVRADNQIWRLDRQGRVLETWRDLKTDPLDAIPMMGNRLFDADYAYGHLSVAYWGARQWLLVGNATREVIHQFQPPFLPHQVAADGDTLYILASSLDPGYIDGIQPQLLRWSEETTTQIWP